MQLDGEATNLICACHNLTFVTPPDEKSVQVLIHSSTKSVKSTQT